MKRTSPFLHSIFQALSDPYRLRMIMLMLRAKTEMCLCEFSESLEQPEYKLSRHIKVLKSSGLVESVKEGKWVYHTLNKDHQFQKMIFQAIRLFPFTENEFDKDLRRFEKRKRLRENGRCQIPVRLKKVPSKVLSLDL